MSKETTLTPLHIKDGYMTFLFPFSYKKLKKQELIDEIKHHGFTFFTLDQKELESNFYNGEITISHEELDQYFLPFLESKLFPKEDNAEGFLRFSKPFFETASLQKDEESFAFSIFSMDIIVCPFDIGFITIRLKMEESHELSSTLNFMNHFRVLDSKLEEEKGATIKRDGQQFSSMHQFIFDHLTTFIQPFLVHDESRAGYFGSLPFFEDERMMSSAYLFTEEKNEFTKDQLFRIGQLDGLNPDGEPFMSTTNPAYLDRYIERHVHDRWAPDSYTVTSEHTQITITNRDKAELPRPLRQFMSTHYYNLLLHYYYKIMLYRVSFDYSEVKWDKDEDYVEELIQLISIFSSRYYFREVSARTEGKELSSIYREIFKLDELYEEVKTTLQELYKAQENKADKRHNLLLFMLTVFTVISGIYGMNLVIKDWEGNTDWSKVPSYSLFEWISLITALTGIFLSITLLSLYFGKGIWKKIRKWRRDRKV
ncbi:hypothetical protein [Paenisporosarcina cavernae]|uniref:Group-specific protein n=1 Tax=Paenisporosarcina cavernae TaxID=2320858 RepID=A0A385YUE7_9BACL|nr:hypothetical protein [Paenisporosarcina cavernae]AYC29093.1 hypothetical protein D3873_04070 [Paenisporosarcina cavernae]